MSFSFNQPGRVLLILLFIFSKHPFCFFLIVSYFFYFFNFTEFCSFLYYSIFFYLEFNFLFFFYFLKLNLQKQIWGILTFPSWYIFFKYLSCIDKMLTCFHLHLTKNIFQFSFCFLLRRCLFRSVFLNFQIFENIPIIFYWFLFPLYCYPRTYVVQFHFKIFVSQNMYNLS